MYVVPSAYKIILSRSGAHTNRFCFFLAGEQTNSVITYNCAVSVPSRSKYCLLWLLYGCGERFVQYCFLWRSCADAECNVYVPSVYHLAAKQGCTDVRVWLPTLGGLNIFCAHVSRGYLWVSPIFFLIFLIFFVDIGNQTNVTSLIGFFCTRTYTREIWRASRAEF